MDSPGQSQRVKGVRECCAVKLQHPWRKDTPAALQSFPPRSNRAVDACIKAGCRKILRGPDWLFIALMQKGDSKNVSDIEKKGFNALARARAKQSDEVE